MYHHEIHFYNTISKLVLKGQGHIEIFFDRPNLRQKHDVLGNIGFAVVLQFWR